MVRDDCACNRGHVLQSMRGDEELLNAHQNDDLLIAQIDPIGGDLM